MTYLFKRLIASAMLIVTLTACGGSTPPEDTLQTYQGDHFTISVPKEWEVLTRSDFFADIPQQALVAFTSPEGYDGFFLNISVLGEDLNQAVSSIDYGRANINLANQNVVDYEKIQEATLDVGEQKALVHIFHGRLNPSEKLIRFVQMYVTSGEMGYVVSAGMLPDTPKDIRDQIGAAVTSFRLQ
ncbi:hypothetical protein IPJ72_05430 [Candidatus Peregrinibacteria bacterium]|nr:MAG: hypothetical protein IPJ72_05430 [Candidatus Peregrinibacteria bacterium]